MQFALCNEVLGDLPFADQCELIAALGYQGIELAPFTLGEDAHLLPASRRRELRRQAEAHGLRIIGLHWLLVSPAGLSITSDDAAIARRTGDVIERLIGLCADLGGSVLVHGSPAQRDPGDAASLEGARANALRCLSRAGDIARAHGLTYCLEPLARTETPFINTIDEAVAFIRDAGAPGLKVMLDCAAASVMEPLSVAETIRRRWGEGDLAHIQLNDRNRRAPGQGSDDFGPILSALLAVGYSGPVSVEPFIYEPDGPTTAARAIGYLQGLLEGIRAKENGESA